MMTKAVHRPSFRSAAARMRQAEGVYKQVFELSREALIVWTPDFRVANANDAFLDLIGKSRESITGFDIRDAFPGNPGDPSADAIAPVIASFEKVLATGETDAMPLVRHDIHHPDGSWEERYWQVRNSAIRDEDGSVLAIVEHTIDARPFRQKQLATRSSDELVDALVQAHRLNELLGDTVIKTAIERALLRIWFQTWQRPKWLN